MSKVSTKLGKKENGMSKVIVRFDKQGNIIADLAPTKKTVDAPYVEIDQSQLGDVHLDPIESNAREREQLLDKASVFKIPGQKELQNPDRSLGPRLPYTELIRRIQKLNPRIKVVDGTSGSVAIYRPKFYWEYDEQERDPDRHQWYWYYKYAGGCEKHELPEYSHVRVDSSNLPTREIRGWRTVLLSLIQTHTITAKQAHQEFGNPENDQRSTRWFEALAAFAIQKQGE